MIRIGVIGESPYDTNSLCKVWNKEYAGKGTFSLFLKRINGSVLYSGAIERLIKSELKSVACDLFIIVRDLDTARSDKKQQKNIQNWYLRLSKILPNNVLLLNIQELESLILADIDTFNRIYKTKINFIGNPESKDSPKDFLISSTYRSKKRFSESDNQKLIPLLDFEKVKAKCKFYSDFIQELEKQLA